MRDDRLARLTTCDRDNGGGIGRGGGIDRTGRGWPPVPPPRQSPAAFLSTPVLICFCGRGVIAALAACAAAAPIAGAAALAAEARQVRATHQTHHPRAPPSPSMLRRSTGSVVRRRRGRRVAAGGQALPPSVVGGAERTCGWGCVADAADAANGSWAENQAIRLGPPCGARALCVRRRRAGTGMRGGEAGVRAWMAALFLPPDSVLVQVNLRLRSPSSARTEAQPLRSS